MDRTDSGEGAEPARGERRDVETVEEAAEEAFPAGPTTAPDPHAEPRAENDPAGPTPREEREPPQEGALGT